MPKEPKILAEGLTKKFKTLDHTRRRVDSLFNDKQIALRDKKQFYEGLYLKTHVLFEAFIENLFYGLLVENSSIKTPNHIVSRVSIKSHLIARDLVQAGKDYIDWIPYEKTMRAAKLYFRNGEPFCCLSKSEMDDIYKSHVIRNVIAHESKHSLNKFEQHLIASTPLPLSERSPAGYLMGVYAISPRQTRYELFAAKLRHIAIKLTSHNP